MTHVARITKHPTDRDCVLLHTAPDANDRLGRFGPARLSPEHHAFVVHHSHIDALYRFAKRADLHVVDERRTSKDIEQIPPAECSACGQPGSRGRPPAICPGCGETWRPVPPPVRDDPITRTPCPSCSHKQPGRFPYCSRCGAAMAYPDRPKRTPRIVEPKRERLDDPMPLGQALHETSTRAPHLPTHQWNGRTIEDQALPDPETEPEYDPTIEDDWQGTHDEPEVEDPPTPSWGWQDQ